MTEPTRDALHAETIKMLDSLAVLYREDLQPDYADEYAHAAACVRRVPELEAEVERLRAKAAIVDAMERGEILQVERTIATKDMRFYVRTIHQSGYGETLTAAYAAATREGTD